ncbi:MAG: hypothetical protein R3A51_12770 [Nannocystaceae bacterium]
MSDENLRPVVRDATLEIYDECDPVLETGKTYPVTVGQQAVELRPGGKEETLLSVSGSVYVKIVGPRVRLDPADIAGVYPAAGSDSSPDEYLPHVALVRRTLPWERNGPVVDHPWMALIVLSEDELRTARVSADGGNWVRTVTRAALQQEKPGVFDFLSLGSDALKASDTVDVVDVPDSLKQQVIPALAELPLLCHMQRLRGPDHPMRAVDDDGDVAVVVAHRLPDAAAGGARAPLRHVAFLISLEGRTDLAAQAMHLAPTLRLDARVVADDRVTPVIVRPRVVASTPFIVLHHWSFTPSDQGDFEAVIRAIQGVPNGGVLRYGALPRTAKDAPLERVVETDGHTKEPLPFKQTSAQVGEYRGPLRPYDPEDRAEVFALRAAPAEFVEDKTPGPHDYSTATAFEIGRLLALADEGILRDIQAIGPRLREPELGDILAIDDRPAALQRIDELINPDPTKWAEKREELLARWVMPAGERLLAEPQALDKNLADPAGLRGFLERAPGLAQQVLGRLAGAQTQVGVEVAIDLGGITLGELEQKFGGLLNKARY